MRRHWFSAIVVGLLACETLPSEDASDGTTGDGDGDPTGGDGDGDETAGDGDGDETTSDGDGDPDECTEPMIECPDGSCHSNASAYPCCDYGGECDPLCDMQDAMSSEPVCDSSSYAWSGEGCSAICGCVGADCAALYETATMCLMSRDPACGGMDFDTCPFEQPVGPTLVSGTTSEGQQSFTYGVFGEISGDAEGIDIHLATAPEALGNFAWVGPFTPFASAEVLNIEVNGTVSPGPHSAFVRLQMPVPAVMGTVTIIGISDTEVSGTVTVDAPGWSLAGEFAVPRCQEVDTQYP